MSKINFVAYSNSLRVQMQIEGLMRFAPMSYIITQAARNGARRESIKQ